MWPPPGARVSEEPWLSFVAARDALAAGRAGESIVAWTRITQMPDLESRHYLQAWHFLRTHGAPIPPARARQLLGVVLEVPMNGGLDLLAAYPDHRARYYNYSGAGVIWEHPDRSVDAQIDALLAAGQDVVHAIDPFDRPRPAAPPAGHIRINFLSPMGLHFGEGRMQQMLQEPLAKPVIDAGVALMQALIEWQGRTVR